MTTPPITPEQQALATALADPINALLADALRVWGQAIPLETMRDFTARTNKSLAALRSRQKRIAQLMTAAGQPPEPLFDLGEVVCLRNNPSVVGVVASMTGRTVQIRLAPDALNWLAVRFHEIQRVEPRHRPDPTPGLTRAQRAVRAVRRRQELLARATRPTT